MADPENLNSQALVDEHFSEYRHRTLNQFQLGINDRGRIGALARAILGSEVAPTEITELAQSAPEALGWTIASLRHYAENNTSASK